MRDRRLADVAAAREVAGAHLRRTASSRTIASRVGSARACEEPDVGVDEGRFRACHGAHHIDKIYIDKYQYAHVRCRAATGTTEPTEADRHDTRPGHDPRRGPRAIRAKRPARQPPDVRFAAQASCCGPDGTAVYGDHLYADADRASLPDAALLASLGCGNPTAVAELREGERVLDLGSGGGIDVILSARRVGPTGQAFGLDMTDEMLELAVRNAAEAGVTNVEFVRGTIESVPLPSSTIDVVISNCVINLAADKAAVFREIARVLRPGGRVGVSDVVADDGLTPGERAERGSFVELHRRALCRSTSTASASRQSA